MKGVMSKGILSEGVLSGGGFVLPSLFGSHVPFVPFTGKHYLTPCLTAGGKPSSLSGVWTILIYKRFN